MAGKRQDYDASRRPKNWLKLDEDKRLELVLEYHAKLSTPHPKTRAPRVHAAVHVIVETQLATGDPPSARAALERLLSGGLDRHEAVHAIASVAVAWMEKALKSKEPLDAAGYGLELDRLTVETWRESQSD